MCRDVIFAPWLNYDHNDFSAVTSTLEKMIFRTPHLSNNYPFICPKCVDSLAFVTLTDVIRSQFK